MKPLSQKLDEHLQKLATKLHLTIVLHAPPFEDDDPGAMFAGIPDLRVERGKDSYPIRRSRLAFRAGSSQTTILATLRCWPLPASPGTGFTAHASSRTGRLVPVATVDAATRTLHVLVDFESALPVPEGPPIDDEIVFRTVFEGPIRAFLRTEKRPRVGPEFARRLRELELHHPPGRCSGMIEREIERLESIPQDLRFVGPRARNRLAELRDLKSAWEQKPHRLDAEALGLAIERLERLVTSRAVSVIRIHGDTIQGLANPVFPIGGRGRMLIPAHVFAIRLDPKGHCSQFRFADPNTPAIGANKCLGYGELYFPVLSRRLGAYGLLDGVLNFRESNFQSSLLGLEINHPRVARFLEQIF